MSATVNIDEPIITSRREVYKACATAWDKAIASLVHEDGLPVTILSAPNPYRSALEAADGR
jgi:hypothetical protein